MFYIVLRNTEGKGQIFRKNLSKKEAIGQADIMTSGNVYAEVRRTKNKELIYTTKKIDTDED